jgi:pilus assembly protein Flp/PilA
MQAGFSSAGAADEPPNVTFRTIFKVAALRRYGSRDAHAGGRDANAWRPAMKFINKLLRDEAGATAIEYGLIAALIAVAAIAAMGTLGSELTTTFDTVGDKLAESNTVE